MSELKQIFKIMKSLKLCGTDNLIPVLGLGTWQATSADEIEMAVTAALECGYRHIDTAFYYGNESEIGKTLKKWTTNGLGKREELFITTKLPPFANRAEDVPTYIAKSLVNLQLSYMDLYLIHHPFGMARDGDTYKKDNGVMVLDFSTDHISLWKALEKLVEIGLCKNIGLSNFNQSQIENILRHATIKPSVLQVELHACFQQKELVKFCAANDIVVMAYSPLGSPGAAMHFQEKYQHSIKTTNPLKNPAVLEISDRLCKAPAQILLQFMIHNNIVVIPKSSNKARIQENIESLSVKLEDSDIAVLEGLDLGENGRMFNFLFWKGVEKHPEYPFLLSTTNLEESKVC